MSDTTGRLRQRVTIWEPVKQKNELGETDHEFQQLCALWAAVIPQTGNMQKAPAETILTRVTHKIIIRYREGITKDMQVRYAGHCYEIRYVLDPYFKHESLELFVEEVLS